MKPRWNHVALPRWLARSAASTATTLASAMHAITNLIEVGRIAEGATRAGRWRLSNLDGVRERLGGVYQRLQIQDEAIIGSAADYDDCVERAIGGPLDAWVRASHLLADVAPLARLYGFSCWALERCTDPRLARASHLGRRELADVLSRVHAAYQEEVRWYVAGPRMWSRPDAAGTSPFDVLRMCVAVLHARRPERELSSLDLDALLLFGASLTCITRVRQCMFCFRWAMPGHSTCARHSLSEEAGGNRLERQARYAKAKAILKLAGAQPSEKARWMFRTREEAFRTVSQIIWPVSGPRHTRQARMLVGRLPEYPYLARELGVALSELQATDLAELLRHKVDPAEYRLGAWGRKLFAADAWIYLEGMPSRQIAAWDRARKAISSLPAQGEQVRCKRIAAAIGMSASAFSHWIDRRRDVPMVLGLAHVVRGRRKRHALAKPGRS